MVPPKTPLMGGAGLHASKENGGLRSAVNTILGVLATAFLGINIFILNGMAGQIKEYRESVDAAIVNSEARLDRAVTNAESRLQSEIGDHEMRPFHGQVGLQIRSVEVKLDSIQHDVRENKELIEDLRRHRISGPLTDPFAGAK